MNVSQILKTKGSGVVWASSETTVRNAIEMLAMNGIGAMPILKNKELVGIISERDFVIALASGGSDILDAEVGSLMTCDLITCSLQDTVQDLMELMTERRVRHIPVVEKGKMIGIVSIGDVVKERLTEAEREAEALKTYIANG